MTGNGWAERLAALAVFAGCATLHYFVADVPNTPVGMFEYHSTAAAVDGFLAVCCSIILTGGLRRDMQLLCIASMNANFVGWILYLMYLPPTFYNGVIWAISGVQLIRLFSGGVNAADPSWIGVVHRRDTRDNKFCTGKADT